MNYGKGITTIREALEMDTIDFADLCDMTPGQIFKIEENCEELTMNEALKLCKQLKIPIDFLLGLSAEMKDYPPEAEEIFIKIVPKLTEATLLSIRCDHKKSPDDLAKIKKIMAEVELLLKPYRI